MRIDGQKSAYPIMKQGGDTNTIQVVAQVRQMIHHLIHMPRRLKAHIAFDQSVFVKEVKTVLLSIPFPVLATFMVLFQMGGTVNTMILGGLALAFSRTIDNSVISLENIYRHLEMGSSPQTAAEQGGAEASLAVLAATQVDVVDFFPVMLLYGVSKFLFSALALAFCLSMLASLFDPGFERVLDSYERWVRRALKWPAFTVAALLALFAASLSIYPFLGLSFFPRTDASQFNLKAPTGRAWNSPFRMWRMSKTRSAARELARSEDDRLQHRRRK